MWATYYSSRRKLTHITHSSFGYYGVDTLGGGGFSLLQMCAHLLLNSKLTGPSKQTWKFLMAVLLSNKDLFWENCNYNRWVFQVPSMEQPLININCYSYIRDRKSSFLQPGHPVRHELFEGLKCQLCCCYFIIWPTASFLLLPRPWAFNLPPPKHSQLLLTTLLLQVQAPPPIFHDQ